MRVCVCVCTAITANTQQIRARYFIMQSGVVWCGCVVWLCGVVWCGGTTRIVMYIYISVC